MKKSLLCLLVGGATLNASITINDIDKLVNDIKEERVGLTEKEIATAKDPFIYLNGKFAKVLKTGEKKKRYRFVLSAIVNDHVKINHRWYRLHGKVKGFDIAKVGKNYVVLARNKERIRVFLKRPTTKKIKLIVK